MGKYEPLAEMLRHLPEHEWEASFAEVEEVLGFSLPASARRYREWWANQRNGGHSQAKGWQEAGWRVGRVDLDRKLVVFRRSERSGTASELPEKDWRSSDEKLFERACYYLGTTDREQIVREAMKALCEREAARRLARLGGTMPDLKAPPRRRFGG